MLTENIRKRQGGSKTMDSRLIMLEGLPGTGKSTNSYLLAIHLKRKGNKVKWIHEVARPHPTSFFSEACI